MTQREKEYMESYREINWTMLIVWAIIAIIAIAFAFLLGFVAGEYIIPILSELTFEGWLGIFIIVCCVFTLNILYHKIKKSDNELWGDDEN